MATQQEIAAALRYGPDVQKQVRRSEYLDDALKAMATTGGQDIRGGWGDLAARLAALALYKRGSDRASEKALGSLGEARKGTLARALAGITTPAETPPAELTMPMPSGPPLDPSATAPTTPMLPPPTPVEQAPLAAARPAPQNHPADLSWRANVKQESNFNPGAVGPQTQYGQAQGSTQMLPATAQAMAQKLGVPWRPELMVSRAPKGSPEYEEAARYQDMLGRAYWDEGLEKYGGDPRKAAMYYHGGPNEQNWGPKTNAHADAVMRNMGQMGGDVRMASGPAPQQPMQLLTQFPQQPGQGAPPPPQQAGQQPPMQPFQLAANGPMQPGMMPSAQGSSPPAAGTPPAAPPQAAAGGNQAWPTYRPGQQEVAYIKGLIESPRYEDQERGLALAQQMQQRMSQPAPAKIVQMNGVSFYVSETPGAGGQPVMIPVPQGAMNRTVDARTVNPAARAGMQAQLDPFGNAKEGIGGPPENMEAVRNPVTNQLEYVPVKNSAADPRREMPPAQGYGYAQSGRQGAIEGGPADMKSPQNIAEGANRYGGMIKTIVDAAMKVKQNYGAVQTGYRQQNGPGDIAMTNGIQKLIDEGVVKGEDVNMQMQSNGLQGTLGSWSQYAQSGGLFTPEVRAKIHKTATDLYQNLDRTYKARVTSLQPGFDEFYGQGAFGKYVFPDAFAQELGWVERPGGAPGSGQPAPQAQYPAPVAQRHQEMVRMGQYDPQAPLGSAKRPALARTDAEVRAFDIPANKGKHVILPNGSVAVID